jgi:hypothetical protein
MIDGPQNEQRRTLWARFMNRLFISQFWLFIHGQIGVFLASAAYPPPPADRGGKKTGAVTNREIGPGYPPTDGECCLHSAKQQQDDQDHHDESYTAARAIAPIAAVGPSGQADDEKNDQDEEYQDASAHQ